MAVNNDNKMIGPSEVAKILNISLSSVRRLADLGKLKCYKIMWNNHRKFKVDDVIEFKRNQMIETTNNPFVQTALQLSTESKQGLVNVSAKAHPAHYMMHKYWGRKPSNVIKEYILHYTEIGDVVLDPFMGSGVVPIEAVKTQRTGVGVDINPMSKFIVENTLSEIDIDNFKRIAFKLINEIELEYQFLYETECPVCSSPAHVEIAIWDHDELARLRINCKVDGMSISDVKEEDKKRYDKISTLKQEMDKLGEISYPMDKVLKYVKRSGKEGIDELFTDRALIILSKLRDKIVEIEDKKIRELLLFCFTSMLPNVSNMLPADLEKATYKSGWVISKFRTPKIHTERSIFHCFKLRINAIIKGKRELQDYQLNTSELYTADSTNLYFIDNESVDYIFTDPPYGESIAYLALSQFWNSWLNKEVDYSSEIILDSYRDKGYEDYSTRMNQTYSELYRVLKDCHNMSFTFHNRDLFVWKAVMDACKRAGFILESVVLQEQAVSSGTQGINKKNTLTGDFVYTFKKDKSIVSRNLDMPGNSIEIVKDEIEKLITEYDGITPTKLYELLIPVIIENNAYCDENGSAIDIDKLLKQDYEYVDNEMNNVKIGDRYKWQKKEQ